MKKIISSLLAMLMILSLGITGYAEEEIELTTDLVLERLIEGDEASETVGEQAANGAIRLAEMVTALDNLSIETQGEADHLNKILDMLARVDVPEESIDRKLAAGAMKTFEAFVIFQQQVDPEGEYADEVQQVFDSFLANDEKVEEAKGQAVNGLYHSVIVTSVIARGFCKNQGMVKQINAELEAFNRANKSGTSSDLDQLRLGAETLFRMLTAISSILDSSGSYSDEVHKLSENTYTADEENDEPTYKLANWLYGCVYMTEMIAREIGA